jgi:hypothetical protein
MEKFSPSETIIKLTQAATGYATAKARVKCGGLSTPQRTMRLSVVPVEMTRFVGVAEKGNCKCNDKSRFLRMTNQRSNDNNGKSNAGPSTPTRKMRASPLRMTLFYVGCGSRVWICR